LPIELDDAYTQTFDRLRRMFRARGCSAEEAADLAQEAAVRAFMHIRRWGVAQAGLDPLLNRIARNLLIDRYRRVAPHLVPLDSADDIQDPAQDPTEEVARRQRRSAVHSAIRSLPTRHRTAIAYSLSGLSPEEVGKQMGIGRNAADALLHRARRSLREHLAPVRDGMWALALGVRVRLDRITRRAGGAPAGIEGVSSLGAGFSVAAVAVVAALAVTAAAPAASIGSRSASSSTGYARAVRSASGGGAASGSSASGGGSGIDHVSTHSLLLVHSARTSNDHGSTTTISGPSDKNGTPIAKVQDRAHGSDGPDPNDPIGSSLGAVVRAA